MGIRGVQKHITRLGEWLNARDAATVAQPMSFGEFSKVLDVGYHTIGNWVKDGSIKTNPSGQIVPVDVLSMLRNPPAPVAEAETPTTPVPRYSPDLIELTRTRMCMAAKEAARDVVLLEADRAKREGNHELRAQLLDDFIHLEEGLRVTFQERQ